MTSPPLLASRKELAASCLVAVGVPGNVRSGGVIEICSFGDAFHTQPSFYFSSFYSVSGSPTTATDKVLFTSEAHSGLFHTPTRDRTSPPHTHQQQLLLLRRAVGRYGRIGGCVHELHSHLVCSHD